MSNQRKPSDEPQLPARVTSLPPPPLPKPQPPPPPSVFKRSFMGSREMVYSAYCALAKLRTDKPNLLKGSSTVTQDEIDMAFFCLMELTLDKSAADPSYRPLLSRLSALARHLKDMT